MKILNSIINYKYIKLILIIPIFICYIISAYCNITTNFIMYTIYGLILFLMLIGSKNTETALYFSLIEPFTICNIRFDNNYIHMLSWFIPLIFLIIGIIINHIIYKPKLKIGKFTIGLAIYFLGVSLGGMFSKTSATYEKLLYSWWFTPLTLISFAIIVLGIIYFTSTTSGTLEKLACDSFYITLLIVLELIFFMIKNNYSIYYCLQNKCINLGWGVNNIVAIVMLMCMPLGIYNVFINFKKYWYYLIAYIIQFGIIILVISKGAILAALIGTVILFVGLLFYFKKYCKTIIISFVSYVIVCLTIILILKLCNFNFSIYLQTDSALARPYIWEEGFKVFSSNKVFGIGIVAPWSWNISITYPAYQYLHNTFIHSLVITGIFGFICFLYHLLEKYARIIYKMNFKKFIFLCFYIFPALYGLMDNTYLEVTYMFFFLYALILFENEIKDDSALPFLLEINNKNKIQG